jgi:hypothetical protein
MNLLQLPAEIQAGLLEPLGVAVLIEGKHICPPCLCPDMVPVPVTSTFLLTPTGYDGLYNVYAVTSVNWRVPINGADMIVTGSGTYKVGGEVAFLQELALDLQLGGAHMEHFDSGLVPVAAPFPEIKVAISTTNKLCFAAAFKIDASPAPALQPRLGHAGSNTVVLSWPVSADSFVLKESSDLTATNWTAATVSPPAAAEPAPSRQTVRIKAGTTSSYTDSNGNAWLPDQGFADGETIARAGEMPIANTKDSALYRTERYLRITGPAGHRF